MDAQRDRLAQRQAIVLHRKPLLVEPVAGLVQDAEEGGVEKVRVEMGGDAAVVRAQRGAERMGCHVQPPAVEVEADGTARLAAEGILGGDRKVAGQNRGVRPSRAMANGRHQRHQLLPQPGQHAAHVGCPLLRLVVVQQGVVGALGVADGLRLLALQADHRLQKRPERGEVVVLAGLLPRLLAQHGGAGQLLDQALRQLHLAVHAAFQVADHYGRVRGAIAGKRTFGQLTHVGDKLRIGPAAVEQAGNGRELLGPIFPGGRRQLRPLVPSQGRLDRGPDGGRSGVLANAVVDCVHAEPPSEE